MQGRVGAGVDVCFDDEALKNAPSCPHGKSSSND